MLATIVILTTCLVTNVVRAADPYIDLSRTCGYSCNTSTGSRHLKKDNGYVLRNSDGSATCVFILPDRIATSLPIKQHWRIYESRGDERINNLLISFFSMNQRSVTFSSNGTYIHTRSPAIIHHPIVLSNFRVNYCYTIKTGTSRFYGFPVYYHSKQPNVIPCNHDVPYCFGDRIPPTNCKW